MKTQRPEEINQDIQECRTAIAGYERALAAAARRANQPNASYQEKLQELFYQQEIRELKKWLDDAERELASSARSGEPALTWKR